MQRTEKGSRATRLICRRLGRRLMVKNQRRCSALMILSIAQDDQPWLVAHHSSLEDGFNQLKRSVGVRMELVRLKTLSKLTEEHMWQQKTVSSTSDDPTRMLHQILVQRFSHAQCRFVQETNVGHFTLQRTPLPWYGSTKLSSQRDWEALAGLKSFGVGYSLFDFINLFNLQ
ncbi:hypothetical protein ARMGADRAFT_1169186 [Armillaria gallica]|uniref:Uncharacterized protein n=1 Tax=Armillaria gallica TaxID=47427 RepID=A0A2H3CTW6_ARMGA|nr:hypothetical protein ARMGADRAFT_1169186 [Armillaria gallica]